MNKIYDDILGGVPFKVHIDISLALHDGYLVTYNSNYTSATPEIPPALWMT